MRILLLAVGSPGGPERETIPGDGTILRSTVDLVRVNGLPYPREIDLVLLEGFSLASVPAADAALLRAALRDDAPIVRVDRLG